MDKTITRITHMERCFDVLSAAASATPDRLWKDAALKDALRELREYYEGEQWLRDYELDERGLLPPGLKRGVLSQDAVYDLLDLLSERTEEENDMKFEEMLLKRESCRAYRDQPVSREDILKVCDAGRLSPSGCNSQPWKFIVVDEPEAKARLCDALLLENGKTGAPWREQCPAFIVIVEQKANVMPIVLTYYQDSQRFAQGDIGMAAMNMCYQAMELGLSTCIIGMNSQEKMETALGIPDHSTVRLVLALGYAAEEKEPRPKMRKPLEEVVCFNGWS